MNAKYELLENDTKEFLGRKLYRIKALIELWFDIESKEASA